MKAFKRNQISHLILTLLFLFHSLTLSESFQKESNISPYSHITFPIPFINFIRKTVAVRFCFHLGYILGANCTQNHNPTSRELHSLLMVELAAALIRQRQKLSPRTASNSTSFFIEILQWVYQGLNNCLLLSDPDISENLTGICQL